MKVRDLKTFLEDLPDDMEVFASVAVPVPEGKRVKEWPTPFNYHVRDIDFNDIGWSENILTLGVELKTDDLP